MIVILRLKLNLPHVNGFLGSSGDRWPTIEFLIDRSNKIVLWGWKNKFKMSKMPTTTISSLSAHIAIERIESAEHGPSRAKGLRRIISEPADVGADNRDVIDGRHAKDTSDAVRIVVIGAQVITEPLSDLVAIAGERRAGYDKCTFAGTTGEESVVRRRAHHGAVEVV